MYDIALRIKLRDWFYILLIGIVFAMLLSAFGYTLLGYAWMQGALFGILLGFTITLFSLFFITIMNQQILPKIDRMFWLPLAVVFSFFSGFLGTMVGSTAADLLGIDLILPFRTQTLMVSTAIGILTYVVGALLYRFVKMRNEKEVVDQHYLQSRLRSLETQLNPHFLFNALNSVAELIHQNPADAENAVLRLSAFLRNTMDEKALIGIGQEVRNARDYVGLENIRFAGNIRLHAPSGFPDWMLPKFSVQLLVENAVKHGFDSSMETLNIWLDYDEDRRIVIVKNDGKAMQSTAFGIGLNNLNQRLELLCGGRLAVAETTTPTFHIHIGACHENSDR